MLVIMGMVISLWIKLRGVSIFESKRVSCIVSMVTRWCMRHIILCVMTQCSHARNLILTDDYVNLKKVASVMWYNCKPGESEGFDSCDGPTNFAQIGNKSSICGLCVLKIDRWPRKIKGHILPAPRSQVCYSPGLFHSHPGIQIGFTVPKR